MGTLVQFTGDSIDAVLPSTINVYAVAFPLQNGRYRRDFYIPAITPSAATTAKIQTYKPTDTTTIYNSPVETGPTSSVTRAGANALPASYSSTGRITFTTAAAAGVIDQFFVSAFFDK
jgi:hypothetical protein